MAGSSGAPPTQRSARPKAPEVERGQGEVKVTVGRREEPPISERSQAQPDGPISSQPEPLSLRDVEVLSSPMHEVTASRRLFDLVSLSDGPDGEPVSLSDLQAVFSPGHNPAPRIAALVPSEGPKGPEASSASSAASRAALGASRSAAGATPRGGVRKVVFDEEPDGEAAPVPLLDKPRAADVPDAPASSQEMPVSSSSILEVRDDEPGIDVDFGAADEPRAAQASAKPGASGAAKKPSAHLPFFDVGDIAAPGEIDLFSKEPAPFDPSVPPLPVEGARISEAPHSGLRDIRSLVEREDAQEDAPKRTDFALFNISGGLFDEPQGALGPPDAHRLAQAAPRSVRPSRSSSPPSSQRPIAPVLIAPATAAGAERAPRRPAASYSQGVRTLIGLALGALLGLVALLVFRLARGPESATEVKAQNVETATVPARTSEAPPLPTATQARATADAPAPSLTTTVSPTNAPPINALPTSAPTATALATNAPTASAPKQAPTAVPTAEKAPPADKTAATAETKPPLVEIPQPSGGAEFDRGAAKAALAAAAGRAAGCKPADDPGGGAKVSVTFAPSGRVTSSRVTGPPYQGTAIGGCIAAAFRSASVPPFDGDPVTVTRDVTLR
jgi:hypothetical protein